MSETPLETLARHDEACRLMFLGLYRHYTKCLAEGRMDLWKQLGHGAIDVLASTPDLKIHKRTACLAWGSLA
ncbi:MAG: hypothetical protein KIT15_17035 [Xanthobacteraceae bacterium]|nr:hypothetical protein [Xanthobacteraceae bacterium]